MARVRPLRASSLSRELRALGYNVSPSGRHRRHDGVFVRQSYSSSVVSVHVDLPGRFTARTQALDIADSLRERGYVVAHADDPENSQILYISHRD